MQFGYEGRRVNPGERIDFRAQDQIRRLNKTGGVLGPQRKLQGRKDSVRGIYKCRSTVKGGTKNHTQGERGGVSFRFERA